MDFTARVYDTEAAQTVAFERLCHLFDRIDAADRFMVRATVGESEEHPVVIVGFVEDGDLARVKPGHWIGGEPFPLDNDTKAALEKRFLRLAEETADDGATSRSREYPPGCVLHEDGNVGPPG